MTGPRRETATHGAFLVEPSAGVPQVDVRRVDEALSQLAVRQHAVLTVKQLVGLGLSPRAARTRAVTGRLHRVHHGVYSVAPPELLSRNGRFMAATLACGPRAALSHRSAGALLELIRWNARTVEVSVPTAGGRSRRNGLRVHRATTLRPSDIAHVEGIPCTTVARTLLDLAEQLDRRGLERAIDQAAVTEQFDLNQLREQLAHNCRRPAAALLEVVLAEHVAGSTPTWNELEERMLAVSRSVGVPDPEVQKWLDLGDGEPPILADFVWRAERVIVETDGFGTHGTRTAFERDRRRDQRAVAAGWRPIRVTWRQLTNDPVRVGAVLRAVVVAVPSPSPRRPRPRDRPLACPPHRGPRSPSTQ